MKSTKLTNEFLNTTGDYKEELLKLLQNKEARIAYLNEALKEEDIGAFLIAIRDVIEATENMSSVSKKSNLNRQNLYRMLSEDGNPKLENLSKLLESLGLYLSVNAYA